MISMIDGLPAAGRPALPFVGSPGLNFSEDFKVAGREEPVGPLQKTRLTQKRENVPIMF
jgi:hypothetical protein